MVADKTDVSTVVSMRSSNATIKMVSDVSMRLMTLRSKPSNRRRIRWFSKKNKNIVDVYLFNDLNKINEIAI